MKSTMLRLVPPMLVAFLIGACATRPPARTPGDPAFVLAVELSNGNTATQIEILDKLVKLGPGAETALPLVVRLLEGNDPKVAAKASTTLIALDKYAVPAILLSQTHPDRRVQGRVPGVLSGIWQKAKETEAVLLQSLEDPDPNVRVWAAWLIGEKYGPNAGASSENLIRALTDETPSVRREAVLALGRLGPSPQGEEGHLKYVIPLLKDSDPFVRAVTLFAIAQMDYNRLEYMDGIVSALKDKEAIIRLWAAYALRWLGENANRACPQLVRTLDDRNNDVREMAAWALGSIFAEDASDVSPLIKILNDPEPKVKQRAAEALGRRGSKAVAAVPFLTQLLKDPNRDTRRAAAESLSTFGQSAAEAIPMLIMAIDDSDFLVTEYAVKALGNIGSKAEKAIPRIERCFTNSEYTSCIAAAAEALGSIGPGAANTIPTLKTGLIHKEWTVKISAAKALVRIAPGDETLSGDMMVLLKDETWCVREQAILALSRMGPAATCARDAIVLLLGDDILEVRKAAVGFCGDVWPPDLAPPSELLELARDPDQDIQAAAAEAIRRINERKAAIKSGKSGK